MVDFRLWNSTTIINTSCGSYVLDTRIDKLNKANLDAHNKYRRRHRRNELAYDRDLAN